MFRLLFASLLLSACAPFPELAPTLAEDGQQTEWPALSPIAPPSEATPDAEAAEAELRARAAALEARAARLRRTTP